MKIEEIRQLAGWLGDAGLSVIELKRGDESLLLRRSVRSDAGASLPACTTAAHGAQRLAAVVKASGPGVFFATHPDEAEPFVRSGDEVDSGQLVGMLQVGALFLPVRSEFAGRVREVQVADGQVVGFGQTLLELEELAS
ncbi:Biotin carboxyl carrier protein [Pseudomonas flavescens]|uniref:Biotin carboxyl carrier protein n=1 Tax=Phytopseudomonas flavescens TaxID=29435 RepID=A0A1G8HDZ0_9GAMM|nr:biotin/lipoyl-containing protein [Pseudomonas flavescens]SDI04785.1 Biotin carboxyl carrier protein [Pseudomonas flavescens]